MGRAAFFAGILERPLSRVFLVSLLVFSLAAFLFMERLEPMGDEPHYLLATYSLLVDHDLDLANNYGRKDYERFFRVERYPPGAFDGMALEKHAFDYKKDGRLYSVHNVGTSAILIPAYALGGRAGATLFMSFLSALLATQIYALCRSYSPKEKTALLSWAPLALSIPLMPYGSSIYPEVPAALITLSAWRLVFEKRGFQWRHFLAVSLLVGFLPWFHVRYLAASAALLVLCLIRRRKEMGGFANLLSLVGPLAVSAFSLGAFSNRLYGSPSPFAPYAAPVTGMYLETMGDGLLGLWLDQEFGLLSYSPVYLFSILGLAWLVRDKRYGLVLALALVFGSVYLPAAAYGAWWGGLSYPSRFLLVVLPLLAIPTGYLMANARAHAIKIGFYVFSSLSIAIAMVGLLNPLLLLDDADGASKFWAAAGQGRLHLERLLPTLIRFRATWHAESLPRIVGEEVDDPYASNKRSRFSRAESSGFVVYGPYVILKEGRYRATFYMKTDAGGSSGVLARIDASTTSALEGTTFLAYRDLSAETFSAFPRYQDFSLTFATPGGVPVEFRVASLGKANLWVDAVHVLQMR